MAHSVDALEGGAKAIACEKEI